MTTTDNANSTNGWDKYQIMVMTKLEDHDRLLEKIDDKMTDILVEVGMLKIKAGYWGLIGAAIPTIGAILFVFLK